METEAAQEKAPVITIDTIQTTLQAPGLLTSFVPDDFVLRLVRRTSKTEKVEIPLDRDENKFFPFFTVYDFKLFLYERLGNKDPRWAPEYQFLAIPKIDGFYSIEYEWRTPGTDMILPLPNPFDEKRVREAALDFVTEEGERKALSYTSKQRFTLENALDVMGAKNKDIYLFLFDDVKAALRVTDERLWNTYLYPYFPSLSYDAEDIPSDLLASRFEKFSSAYKLVDSLEFLAENGNYEESHFKGFRLLQLSWKLPKHKKETVESLFYDAPVTPTRPFMRILPSRGTPVLKIHLKEDRTPDLADIRLLKQWTKERSPVPERDFLLAKVLLKEQVVQQPPIYMTLRLTDKTADATLIPPKGVRKLDFVNELQNLSPAFQAGIEGLSLEGDLRISKGTLNYRIDLNPSTPPFTKRSIRRRLTEKFLPFFEEIESLPGESALLTLRYRAVNNYASEGRIFTFLSQFLTRKDTVGEVLPEDIISQVAREFKLDEEDAEKYVTKWIKNRGRYDAVESSEYVEVNNTGIGISILQQHPWYHVNLYDIDTLENLRRILMLLTIMLMTPDGDLFTEEAKAAARVFAGVVAEEKEEVEREEREKEEEEEEKPPASADAAVEAADDDTGALDTVDMGDFGVEFGEEEDVREFVEKDKEDLDELPPRALVPAPVAAPPPPPPGLSTAAAERNENEESVASSTEEKGLADFFLTKLKEADKRLFDYTKTHPSLKKYVSMCAANVTRQPAVVTIEQFNQMREVIYREDLEPKQGATPRISFIVYPLDEKENPPSRGAEETFYFLRYGTTPQKDISNYYVCSKYFCTRDNLILIERDFKGTRARTLNGGIGAEGSKKENSCPFCGGILVRNRRNPGPNETVLVRQEAPKTKEQFHTHVGFLKKTPHPERDIYLPCCFLKPQVMRITDEQFTRAREYRKSRTAATTLAVKPAVEEAGTLKIMVAKPQMVEDKPIVSKTRLQQVVERTSTHYIVGSEKLPLEVDPEEGAQIGLCPPEVDLFFGQTIGDFVTARTPHKLKPDARGFLRLGVENRVRFKANSFLAAIAPYYFKESAREIQNLIFQSLQLQPALFFQLNYGNFLLEWFSPAEQQPDIPELTRFLEGEDTNRWGDILQLTNYQKNPDAAKRFYVSWHRFEKFLFSGDTTKEYRQFAPLLAQPGFIPRTDTSEEMVERPGITFIVINIHEDKSIDIQCPPYGFNKIIHGKNDVAFLLHHHSGIWEPLYYIDLQASESRHTLFFQGANQESWPQIVKQRVLMEFMGVNGCASDGKLSYSAWPSVNYEKLLMTTSYLRNRQSLKSAIFHGMLRDSYNHLSALLFESPEYPSEIVPVPCIDTGLMIPATRIYLSRENLNTAHPLVIREFYEKYLILSKLPLEQRYKIKELWFDALERAKESVFILAMQLENGVVVPLNRAKPLNVKTLQEQGFTVVPKPKSKITWFVDDAIVFERDELTPEEEIGITRKEIQDIFEHLRISFSKYLVRTDNREMIANIWRVVDSEETLDDKRESLHVLLGPTIRDWITDNEPEGALGIRRVDCLPRSVDQCTGRCAMSDDGTCAIHAPEYADTEERIRTADLLIYRLIEELLRFPGRRRELLENDVSYMKVIEKPIEEGDQYIIPESSPKWYELLRGEWMKTTAEKPIFFEEISAAQTKTELGEVLAPGPSVALPESLVTFLGKDDPKTAGLFLFSDSVQELVNRFLPVEPGKSVPTVKGPVLERAELDALHAISKIPIAQIDARTDQTIVSNNLFAQNTNKKGINLKEKFFILVQTEEGAAVVVPNPAEPELPKRNQIPKKLLEAFAADITRARNNATRRNRPAAVKKRPVFLKRATPAPATEEETV